MESMTSNTPSQFIAHCVSFGMERVKQTVEHVWLDYDKEADVLYLSLRKPQRTTETSELDNGTLVRKDGNDIVGITFLNASKR